MRLNELTLDVAKVDEGEWKDVPGDADGLRFHLRGRRAKAYKHAYGKEMRKAQRTLARNQGALLEVMQRIDSECLAKHCVLDWGNFLDAHGERIPFTQEFADELMTERKYEPFQEMIKGLVDEIDNGYDDSEEAVAEKS